MKRRDNNRGFTLVELIIAIAILAIAIAPLFSNFIQSSKMNLEGRKSLNAMNLAQDMMEGMSIYKGEEIAQLICDTKNAPAVSGNSILGTILPKASAMGEIQVYDGTEWAFASQEAVTNKEKPDGTKKIGFKFKNVETVVGQTYNKYDVELILDPTGNDQKAFNNQEMAEITAVNQYYDAIFTMPGGEVNEAIAALKLLSTDPTIPVENYYGNIKRTTQILISNSGTPGAPNYKISVNRDYAPVKPADLALADDASKPYSKDNISNMNPDKLPKNIYLYFEGMENAKVPNPANPDDAYRETIEVVNTTGEEVTVYLIRTQKTDDHGVPEDATSAGYSDSFGCEVKVTDTAEKVNIVSNLRYDLCPTATERNIRTTDENGAPIDMTGTELAPAPEGATPNPLTSCYSNERAAYSYNGTKIDETMYKKHFHAGYQRVKRNAIYKVKINIYEAGKSQSVGSYDGGVIN